MHQFIKFILFWNNSLHVLDGLSVHHQEFKTVHTATGICPTEIPEVGKIYLHTHSTVILPISGISVGHIPVAVCKVLNS
jgi:hypothetical protein